MSRQVLLGASAVTIAALILRRKFSRQPELRLTYLDMKGLGEAVRLALHIGGFEFEDRRVGYAEIEALRKSGKLAYGQVPMLEIDGKAYTQSSALLAWAGARGGLYPESLRLRIDGANACLADITGLLGPKWYKHLGGRDPATSQFYPDLALSEEQVAALERRLNDSILPKRFAQLERELEASGGPYLCGNVLTIADLNLYVVCGGMLDGTWCGGIGPEVLKDCPSLVELVDCVDQHPRVADWNRLANA